LAGVSAVLAEGIPAAAAFAGPELFAGEVEVAESGDAGAGLQSAETTFFLCKGCLPLAALCLDAAWELLAAGEVGFGPEGFCAGGVFA